MARCCTDELAYEEAAAAVRFDAAGDHGHRRHHATRVADHQRGHDGDRHGRRHRHEIGESQCQQGRNRRDDAKHAELAVTVGQPSDERCGKQGHDAAGHEHERELVLRHADVAHQKRADVGKDRKGGHHQHHDQRECIQMIGVREGLEEDTQRMPVRTGLRQVVPQRRQRGRGQLAQTGQPNTPSNKNGACQPRRVPR